MAWFEPSADAKAEFRMHPISGKSTKESAKPTAFFATRTVSALAI
ncbi:MAG: hypothetical protein U0Y68_21815 [Blastocatellia bacterium]